MKKGNTAAAREPELAELLAGVLAHEHLPGKLRERILEGLCEIDCNPRMYESPEVLRVMFGFGRAPGEGVGADA